MNGSGFRRQNGVDAPRPPPLQASQGPSGRALFEGYRKDLLTNFQKESPRYNPMNPERVQSSMLVDLKDPIQVHLLTETALADSKEFEILSQEEVDDLKKQCISLTQRIEQTRANLAIQSKYRDAAISMSKLYSPTRTESKRRSLLNRHSGNTENAREAELERQLSQRKCEDLATELFNLEKRIMDPQRRLLQHTAGILQLTHRETKKKNQPQAQQPPNGIPGSPESMYTYSNGRSSYEPPDNNYFDDFDEGLENWGRLRSDPIEIPMRSPIREQTKELRMETDKLREENDRLKGEGDQLRNEVVGLRQEGTQRLQTISETERKLEDLNTQLRDVIIQMNPMQNRNYASPPYGLTNGSDRAIEPGDLLGSQLEYLERGIAKVSDDQENQTSALSRDAEDQIDSLSQQLRDILLPMDPNYPTPPTLTGLETQFRYLHEGLGAIESQLARASEMSNTSSADRQKTEQVEAVLSGLWDIIQSGYADMAQRKEARRKTRMEKGISDDDSDMSGEEAFDPDEQYSLQAFSAKVQWLYSQATILKEQKSVLKRQIKQQRELNNKSDAEKDLEIQRKTEELVQTKNILVDAQKEARDFAEQLSLALEELESARSAQTHATDEAAAFKTTEEQLKQSAAKISALESSSADLQARLEVADVNVQAITVKLEDAMAAKETVDKQLEEKAAALKSKEEELDQMNMTMVQMKTELTIAQAELDSAYGSRSERAAEAAAIASTAQAGKMQSRIEELESELKGTLEEFENMTKETMAAEKEKLDLEEKLDDALAARGSLESEVKALRERLDKEGGEMRAKIAKLQEELDTEKLKAPISGVQAGARPGVGASMLSEQFRTTMREERKRFQEDLRREMTERRKLEEELRQLKKALGPGKSPLSPR